MPVAPSFQELFQAARGEQISKRPDLQVFEGDISEMLLMVAAAMADKCVEFTAASFKATYLDGAAGGDLTTLADDHWNIQRFDAVAATVDVTFTRPTDAGGAGSIPAGTVVATQTDPDGRAFRYTTDTALAIGATDLTATVAATAEVTGTDSNVVPGAINRIVDNLYDSTFTVNNVGFAVGGSEVESDDQLRERVRGFFATLSRGTFDALVFGAKQVPGVVVVSGSVSGTGVATIYVADAAGNSSSQMVNDVQVELDTNWKCFGTALTVVGGSALLQDIDYSIVVTDGTSVIDLEPLIEEAITGTLLKLDPEDPMYLAQIITAIRNVDIDNIENVIINSPVSDVTPTAGSGQVIRAGTITRS